jgi:hypothetical protein
MGFSHDEIYQAQAKFGVSNEQMFENASKSEGQELVPKEQEAQLAAQQQAQEYAREFQLAMQVPDSERAKNGVSATVAGAEQSVGMARMAIA